MPIPADPRNASRAIPRRSVVAGLGLAAQAWTQTRPAPRVIGANDRINLAVIGVGARGYYLAERFSYYGEQNKNACQITAVCDVYQQRLTRAQERHKCKGVADYRELLEAPDVDAVVVAAPDHWHAPIAVAAMERGKDVYLETPLCHTLDEIKQLRTAVAETRRVVQVGSQTASASQWRKAREAITGGLIGAHVMSQGSCHRNSVEGEWNWSINRGAGPEGKGEDYIDWKTWLGRAPKRAFDADRFFRFRKYWDYSGGIATDLFFHVMAALNLCWGEAHFPARVTGSGGIYCFKDEREAPDTFHLVAEYAAGFSVVLTGTLGNSRHHPGLIRGRLGTLTVAEDGLFEEPAKAITVHPEPRTINAEYKAKWGGNPITIPVDQTGALLQHIGGFLACMRSRRPPVLNVETAARAQVAITMSVMSYRQGKVLYFDEKNFKVQDKPVKL